MRERKGSSSKNSHQNYMRVLPFILSIACMLIALGSNDLKSASATLSDHLHHVFINVPWYFSMLYWVISSFLTERTKNKFMIAREGNMADTLYKFIRPEFVYAGMSRPGDLQNDPPKPASEFTIKGGEKVNPKIDGIEASLSSSQSIIYCTPMTWEIGVRGWDVEYNVAEGSTRSPSRSRGEFWRLRTSRSTMPLHLGRRGKMVLSVDNTGSRRRNVAAYRYFVRKPSLTVVA